MFDQFISYTSLYYGCFLIGLVCIWWRSRGMSATSATPPMLPYSVPIIGHALSFAKNSEKLISRGRKYFGDTGNIFSINIAGNTIYVLTDPNDMVAVHSDVRTFTFHTPILETILGSFGISANGSARIMQRQDKHEKKDGVKAKSLFEEIHDMQVKQTSGSDLTAATQQAVSYIVTRLSGSYLNKVMVSRNGVVCIPLKHWARELQVLAMQDVFLGPAMETMSPELPSSLLKYSKVSWQTWYHVPKVFRTGNHRYAKNIQDSFRRYLAMSVEERGAAWSVECLIKSFKDFGLSETDQCIFMHFYYWGISMNPANLVFWLLAHILYNETLMELVRAETALAFKADGTLDTYYLVNSCPRLESVWHEVLRLYTSVTTTRYVTKDTVLHDVHLEKGHAVLFSARQMAFHDPRLGENPLQFDATRFLTDPKRKFLSSHRHFGGGESLCCGRHITKHVHLAFVAQLLRRYSVRLAFPQEFPGVYENEPSIGVLSTSDDIYLQFEERS